MMLNYETFPNPYLVDGLKRYFNNGIDPGSFVAAVLCNDLKEACGRADIGNRRMLFEIVSWLYNEAPPGTWGSPDAYDRLVRFGGMKGIQRHRESENREEDPQDYDAGGMR